VFGCPRAELQSQRRFSFLHQTDRHLQHLKERRICTERLRYVQLQAEVADDYRQPPWQLPAATQSAGDRILGISPVFFLCHIGIASEPGVCQASVGPLRGDWTDRKPAERGEKAGYPCVFGIRASGLLGQSTCSPAVQATSPVDSRIFGAAPLDRVMTSLARSRRRGVRKRSFLLVEKINRTAKDRWIAKHRGEKRERRRG